MSSFFPTFPSSDFGPLFRLLDDYDVHRSQPSRGSAKTTSSIRAFQPKFDVREIKDAYELHGELPGINQEDVSIEFTDPHTLVIKGRTEREYTSGTPSSGAIEDESSARRITDGGSSTTPPPSSSYHKATVEEEEGGANTSSTAEQSSTEVAKRTSDPETQKAAPQYKYWVSERSVGEFHRSFSFPSRVDQDAVKASLKNGILNILVPKATAPASRRIQIE
ncbi:hypothetical protein MMC08_001169 [Hypocenomyce scalaris]|nr:hypothetical protein [Hypocenomyce scalaris]